MWILDLYRLKFLIFHTSFAVESAADFCRSLLSAMPVLVVSAPGDPQTWVFLQISGEQKVSSLDTSMSKVSIVEVFHKFLLLLRSRKSSTNKKLVRVSQLGAARGCSDL